MKTLIPYLLKLVTKQTQALFLSPYQSTESTHIQSEDIASALGAFEKCIASIGGKYYTDTLSPNDFQIADKYAVFLYYLSRSLYLSGKIECATQIYQLNKTLHGLDAFYEVELPEIFMLTHPVGSVLGRAKYGNYFCAYQNCGVGSDWKDSLVCYPSFGEGVVLYGGARVIGKCQVGSNVIFGANAFIIHTDVPDNSIVVGSYPNHRILPNKRNVIKEIFCAKSNQ